MRIRVPLITAWGHDSASDGPSDTNAGGRRGHSSVIGACCTSTPSGSRDYQSDQTGSNDIRMWILSASRIAQVG